MHPAYPGSNTEGHYEGEEGKAAAVLSTANFGWHGDCALQLLKFSAAALFDELPILSLWNEYCGELLLYMFDRTGRSSAKWGKRGRDLRRVSKENMWIPNRGKSNLPPAQLLVKTLGRDKVMYSVD